MEKIAKLKIVDVVKETSDAISIHFKQSFFSFPKIKYTPGQYLTLLVDVDGRVERRCYSLNSAPKIDNTISVTVKRIKDGKVSNFLFNNVKAGTYMKVLYPMGNFTITPDAKKERHVVLFGAGSGITPLMSILKTILHVEEKSSVSLFYGNRDKESIIFSNELSSYKEKFGDRLNLIHILEQPGDFESCYKGRVERTQVPDLLKQVPQFPAEKTEYYICGPSGMMIEAEEGLKMAGVEDKYINMEKFSAPPPSAEEMEEKGINEFEDRTITIKHKGKSHAVPVKADQQILDAALDEKLKLPYVCMDGICGSCQATCSSGEVYMRKGHVLSQKDMDAGQVLPCICKPLTDDVVIEYS